MALCLAMAGRHSYDHDNANLLRDRRDADDCYHSRMIQFVDVPHRPPALAHENYVN